MKKKSFLNEQNAAADSIEALALSNFTQGLIVIQVGNHTPGKVEFRT